MVQHPHFLVHVQETSLGMARRPWRPLPEGEGTGEHDQEGPLFLD